MCCSADRPHCLKEVNRLPTKASQLASHKHFVARLQRRARPEEHVHGPFLQSLNLSSSRGYQEAKILLAVKEDCNWSGPTDQRAWP